MAESPRKPVNANAPPDVDAVRNVGRRRILQAGISAAPVIMTVASRPVLATTNPPGICESPSGFVSATVSGQTGMMCAGLTPGYWKQDQHFWAWHTPYYPTTVTGSGGHHATKFKSVFMPDLPIANLTFLAVLAPQTSGSGPPYNVARHLVAAVLNLAAGYVPATILSLDTIKNIWTQYTANDCYNVGNTCWNEAQIIQYLTSTMD